MMRFNQISYLSKILWRFYGASAPNDPKVGLQEMQYIFKDDKIILQPYHGPDGKKTTYSRAIQIDEEASKDALVDNSDSMLDEKEILYAIEPKPVCYCDIPITHISAHMKKYNSVGLGINRDLLIKKSSDLQPVRYHFIRNKSEFYKSVEDVYSVTKKSDGFEIEMKKYIKIPTLLKENFSASEIREQSESFNSVYEEREWRHFQPVQLEYSDISFVLLPSRKLSNFFGRIDELLKMNVGVIYADELFYEEEK